MKQFVTKVHFLFHMKNLQIAEKSNIVIQLCDWEDGKLKVTGSSFPSCTTDWAIISGVTLSESLMSPSHIFCSVWCV